VIACPAERP